MQKPQRLTACSFNDALARIQIVLLHQMSHHKVFAYGTDTCQCITQSAAITLCTTYGINKPKAIDYVRDSIDRVLAKYDGLTLMTEHLSN